MTKVKFLINEDNGNADLFAFFPTQHYYHVTHPCYNSIFTSYSHIGQHSSCSIEYAKESRVANQSEYKDLLAELKGQGYDDLKVLNKH